MTTKHLIYGVFTINNEGTEKFSKMKDLKMLEKFP